MRASSAASVAPTTVSELSSRSSAPTIQARAGTPANVSSQPRQRHQEELDLLALAFIRTSVAERVASAAVGSMHEEDVEDIRYAEGLEQLLTLRAFPVTPEVGVNGSATPPRRYPGPIQGTETVASSRGRWCCDGTPAQHSSAAGQSQSSGRAWSPSNRPWRV